MVISMKIFSEKYIERRDEYIPKLAGEISAKYSPQELARLVVPTQTIDDYLFVTGDNFPSDNSVNVLLRNARELVTPGHEYTRTYGSSHADISYLEELVRETFDSAYAISYIAISEQANLEGRQISEDEKQDYAFGIAANLLAKVPKIIDWHRWNVFASLKDPAIWSSAVRTGIPQDIIEQLEKSEFPKYVMTSLKAGDTKHYLNFLAENGLRNKYSLLVQLIDSSYDGPKSLLNHYIANQLAKPEISLEDLAAKPLYLIPEKIHQITRKLGLDSHPEADVGYGIFIDHVSGTIVIGQTGVVGRFADFAGGGIVLGGLTRRPTDRHPILGEGISIGTGTNFFGPLNVGDYSNFGVNSSVIGYVNFGKECRIGSDVDIGSYRLSNPNKNNGKPGKIILENNVIVGDGVTIFNAESENLVIPSGNIIEPKSYIEGIDGKPVLVERPHGEYLRQLIRDEARSILNDLLTK